MADDTTPRRVSEPGSAYVMAAPGRCRLVLAGEIDVALGAELSEAVSEAERSGATVEVDARHVTFMDSSGVALLARLAHRSSERLTIIQPPDVVRFLLEITRLGDLTTILDEDPGFPGAEQPEDELTS